MERERTEAELRHERLCAYALGECEAAEREALAAELARSSALRAELETIRATFALVREGLAGQADELSEEALASVLARGRAEAGRARGWRRLAGAPLGRVAAAFALVALGLVVWAEWERRAPAPGEPLTYTLFGEQLARVDQGDERAEAESTAARASQREHARVETSAAQGGLGESGSSLPAAPAAGAVDEPIRKDAQLSDALQARLAELGYGADGAARQSPAVASGPEQAGEARVGMGAGAGGEAVDATTDVAVLAGSLSQRKGDAYRGPGDSLPPAERKLALDNVAPSEVQLRFRPATPGPTGPTGPTGPSGVLSAAGARPSWQASQARTSRFAARPGPTQREGAAGRGADALELGRSEERTQAERDARLRGLGYGDADAGDDETSWKELDAGARAQRLERELGVVLGRCTPLPNEAPAAMFFRFWGDNPFVLAQLDPLATFAADVDTASWPLARNYLARGLVPPREAIRTEEFLNSFRPRLDPPRQGTFAVHAELAPSRFGGDPARWMLSVALKGREVERAERKPLALTFVLDVSGSMEQDDRLGLVKHALRLLAAQLDGRDRIGLVVFSTEARVVLPPTNASQRALIESALEPLRASGSTNAEAGLTLGYQLALAGLDSQATNRVILLSDGVANVGQTDQARILDEVARQRAQGIYLNTIGVGMGNHDDAFLEQLADRGDGVASYVDDEREARKVLVEDFVGSLETIARDVKVQLEVDPATVARWRLLGYENRAVADRDFRDDAVDAGEVGAGHAVVALFELELPHGLPADGSPLASVRVRWKPPFAPGASAGQREALERAEELEVAVDASHATSWEGASAGYRRLVLVAQLAEFLRRSVHAREDSLDDFVQEARALLASEPADAGFAELVALVERNLPALRATREPCDALCGAVEELRELRVREAELQRLRAEEDARLLEELLRQDAALEARIRELVRGRLEGAPRGQR